MPELEETLVAEREIGILRRLVKTGFGFHIVSIDRHVDGRALPFEAAQAQIAERLCARVASVRKRLEGAASCGRRSSTAPSR